MSVAAPAVGSARKPKSEGGSQAAPGSRLEPGYRSGIFGGVSRLLLLPIVLLCAACIAPTRSSDYDVVFARAYGQGRSAAEWERPPAQLTVEQLYALQQYGRRAFHPWRSVAKAFACRGPEAVAFLRSKVTPANLGSLLEVFRWMRWMESYDVAGDSALTAQIRTAYAQLPAALRRAYAEELAQATGQPLPMGALLVRPGPPAALRQRHCT